MWNKNVTLMSATVASSLSHSGNNHSFFHFLSSGASQVVIVVKSLPASAGRHKRCEFNTWVRKIPGGGNGNPPQYSCLENPIDTGSHRIRHDGRDLACTQSCFSKEKDKSFIVILLHWYIKGITLNSNIL